jgi:hypothetical protein
MFFGLFSATFLPNFFHFMASNFFRSLQALGASFELFGRKFGHMATVTGTEIKPQYCSAHMNNKMSLEIRHEKTTIGHFSVRTGGTIDFTGTYTVVYRLSGNSTSVHIPCSPMEPWGATILQCV